MWEAAWPDVRRPRVLAIRGHQPELYEKGSQLGGNLLPGGAPEFKEDDLALAKWYETTLKDLRVPVYYNHEVTKDEVLAGDYDAVIIATGSQPKKFSLGDDEKVYTASQVLLKEKECGKTTVIVGGGLVGCETALWLAEHGKKVTIVEALDKILAVNGPLCRRQQGYAGAPGSLPRRGGGRRRPGEEVQRWRAHRGYGGGREDHPLRQRDSGGGIPGGEQPLSRPWSSTCRRSTSWATPRRCQTSCTPFGMPSRWPTTSDGRLRS